MEERYIKILETKDLADANKSNAEIASDLEYLRKYIPKQLDEKEITQAQNDIHQNGYIQKVQVRVATIESVENEADARLVKEYVGLLSNLITLNEVNQNVYFGETLSNTKLIDHLFDMAWNEIEDDGVSDIVSNLGEQGLHSLLVFIYNCLIHNQEADQDNWDLFMEEHLSILYRVHRYIYIEESDAKEEKRDLTKLVLNIQEWQIMILKLGLKSDLAFMQTMFNLFISKKDRTTDTLKTHTSGLNFLEKECSKSQIKVLRVSKDQILFTSYLKYVIESDKNLINALDIEFLNNYVDKIVRPIIDVFCTHYCDQKLLEQMYGPNSKNNDDDTQLRDTNLLDFLECVQNSLDIIILIITFGEPELADAHKLNLAVYRDCKMLHITGKLMGKIREMLDILVEKNIYKPMKKFKSTLGDVQKAEDENGSPILESSPFAGFLCSVVCVMSTLSYHKVQKVEDFWLDLNSGWRYIGLIMANTKLDIDNPTLREWCMLTIRNLTSWSEPIRSKLNALTMLDEQNLDADPESRKLFESLGQPMKDMYKQEQEKYKKDEEDQKQLQEALKRYANVDVVDF